ncbi:hypothetical protein PV797_10400 [Clostridiaceae bacterium M8S5]|nr:hypothetical protein PV797_10400 [Clostridiaceae bacterium M8S5]
MASKSTYLCWALGKYGSSIYATLDKAHTTDDYAILIDIKKEA